MRTLMIPILTLVGAVALGLSWLAPHVWLVLLTDGLLSLSVLGGAVGWGAWPMAWLGFGRRGSAQQFCIAAALGFGWLSTLTLVLGVVGLLSQNVAWVVIAVGGACGLWRVYAAQSPDSESVGPGSDRSTATTGGRRYDDHQARRPDATAARGAGRYASDSGLGRRLLTTIALLPLAVPIVIALFGATLPPGVLWPGEAFGYDVLEYHLQAPREYFDAGRIEFLPHNVYASFPQQMEMLYLLLMQMADDAHAAAIPAQLLHTIFGGLALLALAAWTRPGWARIVVMLAAGTTPWIAYLGCLAYVENGMLFFAAVAAGLALDGLGKQESGAWRLALSAGLCAGLAGGCKYTGLAFVGVGLGLAWAITLRASLQYRARVLLVFAFGMLLAFSPWLVRNVAFTGNPVYPFAFEQLGGTAWSAEQDARWAAGHTVSREHDSIGARVGLAARELFGAYDSERGGLRSTLFGVAILPLAVAGLILRRSRQSAALTLWGALIVLAWLCLTHAPGRFAMILIAPAALLCGNALARPPDRKQRSDRSLVAGVVVALAFTGAVANAWALSSRLSRHNDWFSARRGFSLAATAGQTQAFVDNHWINRLAPANAHVWLVGEGRIFYVDRKCDYSVVFSQDPWLEYADESRLPEECVGWLRERGVTHVVFVWSEIERLRATYGSSNVVTRSWEAGLEAAGLQRLPLSEQDGAPPGAAVYRVSAR